MQHVENNMDDLFRKAADNYSPDAGDSGWETVQEQLNNIPVAAEQPVINKKFKKNSALWLLLLLPLTGALLSYYFSNGNAVKNSLAATNNIQQVQPDQKKNTAFKNNKSVFKKAEQLTVQNKIDKEIASNKIFPESNRAQINNYSLKEAVKKNYEAEQTIYKKESLKNFEGKNSFPVLIETINKNTVNLIDTNTIIQSSATTKKTVAVTANQKKFYAGVIAGPQFSEVKNQGFKKAGVNAGIIAGYQLNKRVSLETGINYKKRYYFSDGKYFNMDKMPPSMKVLKMEGSSELLEIPVTLKYNLVQKNSSAVFASAGLSSYILLKESNDYNASINGVEQDLKGLYKKASTGLAASVDVSAGYEYKLGKQNTIRIQPYLQIPLKGIGVGNMQVMSTGLNIAVTTRFH